MVITSLAFDLYFFIIVIFFPKWNDSMNVQNVMAYLNVILKFGGWDYFLLFKYNSGLPFH